MYNLLIVDDETNVTDMLAELFIREMAADEVNIYKAYSAKAAMNVLEQVKVDIVLSDIRMPGMTGLELLDRIKANWPQSKVAFLTGYREFEYVYSAIQHSGVRYLLKTSDDQQIVGTVREMVKEISDSRNMADVLLEAKSLQEIAWPTLQSEWLQDFITGHDSRTTDLQRHFNELKIPLNAARHAWLVIGRFDISPDAWQREGREQSRFAVQAIADKFFSAEFSYFGCLVDRVNMAWIVQSKAESASSDPLAMRRAFALFNGNLEFIQESVKATMGITLSLAVSGEHFELSEIAEQYRLLNQIMRNHFGLVTEFFLSNKAIPLVSQIASSRMASVSTGKFKSLEDFLFNGRRDAFLSLFEELFAEAGSISTWDDPIILEKYYRVATMFLAYTNTMEIRDAVIASVDLRLLLVTEEHPSWREAVAYLRGVGVELFNQHEMRGERLTEDVVMKLKSYVNDHLDLDLSLTKLASLFFLNPSYLSRLFKQEAGMNLSDYITDKRIELAKTLLKKSSKKMSEIGVQIGYESQQSFTRFFKNAVGVSPQEYKETIQES